jgi:hypothetical protein
VQKSIKINFEDKTAFDPTTKIELWWTLQCMLRVMLSILQKEGRTYASHGIMSTFLHE